MVESPMYLRRAGMAAVIATRDTQDSF